jgi:ABC-2 type transport system permease protein
MMESLLRIAALARKELLAVFKDNRARNSLLLPPILQCLLFGYAATYDLNHVPYAALDRSHSIASHNLLARFDGTGLFERVGNLRTQQQVSDYINDRRALLAIEIPDDFGRRLEAGGGSDVQIIADGRNSNTAGTALGYAQSVVDAFNRDWRADHGQPGPPVTVEARAWYNPNLLTRWNMIPGLIGTLTMIQTLMLTAMSVAREREQGTFDQLLVTPFRPAEIMAGKALPSMLVGVIQATGVLLVAQLWFRIPFQGSFLTLYAGLILFVLAAVGIGLVVSALCYTMQQAMLFSFILIMPFALLSGLTTPISNMPPSLQ